MRDAVARPRRQTEPVTEQMLLRLSNEALDALFRASPAGKVPDGELRGTAILWPGTSLAQPLAALVYVLCWQGKVADRSRGELTNTVGPLRIRLVPARVSLDASWVDGRPCVLIDYSRTSLVARWVRDEIRLVAPQLYLGVVWLRRRRVGWFALRTLEAAHAHPVSASAPSPR